MKDLSGQTIIVTGGGKGIGRGITTAFAKAGAHVAICGRSEPEAFDSEIADHIHFIELDIREAENAETLIDFAASFGHPITTLINNGIDNIELAQKHFDGQLILNESFDKEAAQKIIEKGTASAVSFGRLFVSNPDLVRRFETGAPLAEMNRNTLYTPGEKGYTDYPSL